MSAPATGRSGALPGFVGGGRNGEHLDAGNRRIVVQRDPHAAIERSPARADAPRPLGAGEEVAVPVAPERDVYRKERRDHRMLRCDIQLILA